MSFPAEGASEEPGDEGADGSDEEPAVGRQRHADAQEVTRALSHEEKHCSVGVWTASWQRGAFSWIWNTGHLCWHFITETLTVPPRASAVNNVLYLSC